MRGAAARPRTPAARTHRRRLRPALTVLTCTLLLASLALSGSGRPGLTEITAAQAGLLTGAGWPGNDVSWPQCPRAQGGYDLPAPPSTARFVVVGLTAGRPHSTNPCLDTQLQWAALNGVPAHAYVIVAFPTAEELRTDGVSGPWRGTDRLDRIRNAGYAQARAALRTLSRNSFRPPVVWLDVEPVGGRSWPTGSAARRSANRALLLGVMRGFADAGVGYGLYSYARAWRDITGNWQLPAVPVWATAGRAPRAAAVRMCNRPSFSGGAVHLAQWYDDTRDSDITCAPFRLVPPVATPPTTG